MRTVTATLQLTDEQAAAVARTAEIFDIDVQTFLGECLRSGIAHAQQMTLTMQDDEPAGTRPPKRIPNVELDDDIPW